MSIELQIKCTDFDQLPECNLKVQYLPVGVDDNVPANVDEFFNNYTREENGGMDFIFRIDRNCFLSVNTFATVMKNSLRGYPLDGCQMKLPENYQGVVYQETKRPLVESTKRFFKTKGIFSEFTYWNYDKEPSNNDALKQALVWNDFANVVSSATPVVMFCAFKSISIPKLQLHKPITLEEFEKGTADEHTAERK